MTMCNRVAVVFSGIPHFYAVCHDCNWTYEDYRDRDAGYKAIRAHVKATGHTVRLEKSVHTVYQPKAVQP